MFIGNILKFIHFLQQKKRSVVATNIMKQVDFLNAGKKQTKHCFLYISLPLTQIDLSTNYMQITKSENTM